MKFTTLVGAVCAAVIFSQAYALQIHKGRLISHKEWSTGNAIPAFLPGTLHAKKSLMEAPIQVLAETGSESVRIGDSVSVGNNALIQVLNNSNEIKSYVASLEFCAFLQNHITDCMFSEDIVELEPYGDLDLAKKLLLTLKFTKAGVHEIRARSIVIGEDDEIVSGIASGTIIVN